MVILSILSLFPIFYLVLTSIKPDRLLLAAPPRFIFAHNFSGYGKLFIEEGYLRFLQNSVIVTVSTTIITTFLGLLGAFAFVKLKFLGKRILFFIILITRAYPPVTTLIPMCFAMRYLGLVDTRLALIICYGGARLALAVFILQSFVRKIPNEIQECAALDGCSTMGIFFRIVAPLTMPGILACAILVFVFSWNELLFGMVLTSVNAKTLPVALSTFRESDELLLWGSLSVLGVATILPVLVFALLLRKYLVKGLMLGGLKE